MQEKLYRMLREITRNKQDDYLVFA